MGISLDTNACRNRSKLIQLWYRHLCLNFTPSAPAVSAFAAAAPLNMPGLISTDQAVLQDFIAEFKTMTNEDRVAANAEQRATSMRVSNENLLRKLRQGAQRRLDVALLRCCQDWFSAPAKKKKAGSAPTLLGLCTKWWREVKEILLWRAQLPGVRVEVGASACVLNQRCVYDVERTCVDGSFTPYLTSL